MRNIYPLGKHSFDLDRVSCVGPSWTYDGIRGDGQRLSCEVYLIGKADPICVNLASWHEDDLMMEEKKAIGERARSAFIHVWEASKPSTYKE